MRKVILIICVLIFLIASPTTLAVKSSEEYINCLSEKLYNNCSAGLMTYKKIPNGWEPDTDIEPFTRQSILNWLKNYESQFASFNGITGRLLVLACKKQDDYSSLERHDSDKYTLDGILIACPKTEHNFIKFEPSISLFGFSPFSINFFPITIFGGLILLLFLNKKYKWVNIKINFSRKK